MRIVIFGETGQVARELRRARWPTGCSLIQLGRADCDLADAIAVRRAVLDARPDLVVNAAAYTAVDRAECEPDLAVRVNRDAPGAMASVCNRLNAPLIHLSTDYVFDGKKSGAYVEDDPIVPLSVYGRTKADGEGLVRELTLRHIILRTSWVFAAHGSNFVRSMLRLAADRQQLRVVCDQRGAPTAAHNIAEAIVSMVDSVSRGKEAWGTFHFTSAESTTWHGFAETILRYSGVQTELIPITTAEYKTVARRPSNSVLDCSLIAQTYGIDQPSWQLALAEVLTQIHDVAAVREDASG